jgi:hypothetical protein
MKQISNYPNYLVTSNGSVFSLFSMKYLKPKLTVNGYHQVQLFNNEGEKWFLVHRLVAEAYTTNVENKRCVNHMDGVKTNNCLLNLEWATDSENHKHAFRTGLRVNGEKQRNAIRETGKRLGRENGIKGGLKKRKLVLNNLTGIFYNGLQEAADSIGIKRGTLNSMMTGQNPNRTNLRYV